MTFYRYDKPICGWHKRCGGCQKCLAMKLDMVATMGFNREAIEMKFADVSPEQLAVLGAAQKYRDTLKALEAIEMPGPNESVARVLAAMLVCNADCKEAAMALQNAVEMLPKLGEA